MFKVTLTVSVLWTIVLSCFFFKVNAQDVMVGDNPPAIMITPSEFGADSVLDSLQSLRMNLDKAQLTLDSLTPNKKGFKSQAHRAAFYQAAAELKKANVQLFSYMAGVDPENRLSWIQKARQSKLQSDVAMNEYYKALPSEDIIIQHTRLRLGKN